MASRVVQIHGQEDIDQLSARGVSFILEVPSGEKEGTHPLGIGAEVMYIFQGYVRVRGSHLMVVELDDLETEDGTVEIGYVVLMKRELAWPTC